MINPLKSWNNYYRYTFERIHKSYLVKMSEVNQIVVKSGSKYMAVLKNGERLFLSEERNTKT